MVSLDEYGYQDFFRQQFGQREDVIPARVTAVHRELCHVVSAFGEGTAKLKGAVYFHGGAEEYPTVGDFVLLKMDGKGEALICGTLRRFSCFSRIHPDPGRLEQVVAANFDYVFLVASLNQDFNLRRLERYLTAAWQSGAVPVVVLTKADLCPNAAELLEQARQVAVGADVLAVSALTGLGIGDLQPYLAPGNTVVLMGSSGVGKSSLVNALLGEEHMEIREIRVSDGRGRHTTTHRELIRLPGGGLIIDTPGMRTLGIWDARNGIEGSFPEIEELSAQCRFADCRHENEPGCAVKAALESGALSWERWNNYQQIQKEAVFSDRKASFQMKRMERRHETVRYRRRPKNMRTRDAF